MGEGQRRGLEGVPQHPQGWPGGTCAWALGQQKQQLGYGQADVEVLCGGTLSPPLARHYRVGGQERGAGGLEVAQAPKCFL